MTKRLYRVEDSRILGGVCGGIAEYFQLDPTIVRLGFVFVCLLGGAGILLYLIMWVVVPPKSKV